MRILRLLAVVSLPMLFVVVATKSPGCLAQTPEAASGFTFDVASIRPVQPQGPTFDMTLFNPAHAARFEASAISIGRLIGLAYQIREDQIEDAPDWINSELYAVKATSDEATDLKLKRLSDEDAEAAKRHMLQALLAERFAFTAKPAKTKELIYKLAIDKGGIKFHPSSGVDASAPLSPNHQPFTIYRQDDAMVFSETTLTRFAAYLSSVLNQQVTDQTGLSGTYAMRLRFRLEVNGQVMPGFNPLAPLLEEALPAQLGLKLVSEKGSVQTISIVHIQKPSPN